MHSLRNNLSPIPAYTVLNTGRNSLMIAGICSSSLVWGLGASFNKAPENAWWIEASLAMDCAFCSAGEGGGLWLTGWPCQSNIISITFSMFYF